jgi:hypothetical protein
MAEQVPARAPERDWTVEVTNRIESLTETVREKTTVPVLTAAQILVFGVVAAVLALVAFFCLVVSLIRVLDVYLPIHPVARRIWVVDAIVSAIFLLAGAFLWRKRSAIEEIP